MRRKLGDLVGDLLFIVLAGDLLYLYYAGGWYDPYILIEVAELTILWTIIAVNIIRFSYHLRIIRRLK